MYSASMWIHKSQGIRWQIFAQWPFSAPRILRLTTSCCSASWSARFFYFVFSPGIYVEYYTGGKCTVYTYSKEEHLLMNIVYLNMNNCFEKVSYNPKGMGHAVVWHFNKHMYSFIHIYIPQQQLEYSRSLCKSFIGSANPTFPKSLTLKVIKYNAVSHHWT